MTSSTLTTEQIQDCENFIVLVMKKIIKINEWNLWKTDNYDEKLEILRLYLKWSSLDLWPLKRQFVNLWLTWYINPLQLEWKLKRLIFYFVFLNKKDPFIFIDYFEYFRNTHIESFEKYVFDKIFFKLIWHKEEINKQLDSDWNLDKISYKWHTYFKRNMIDEKLWLFDYMISELKKEFEYKDEIKNDDEERLKIEHERIYFDQFKTLWLDNSTLITLINFSKQEEWIFNWTTKIESYKFDIPYDELAHKEDEEELEDSKKYGYYFYFDYHIWKHYDIQCKEFFDKYYYNIIDKFYKVIQQNLDNELTLEKILSYEWKIWTTILSLIQIFWLLSRTNLILDMNNEYYEKAKKLFECCLYLVELLNCIQWNNNELIIWLKDIWNKRKIWYILWHTDISIKNNIKLINEDDRDDFLNMWKNYILTEIFWYTENNNQLDDIKSILWFSHKNTKWWNNQIIFKHFFANIPRIQNIEIQWKEYFYQNQEEIKKLYLSKDYEIVFSLTTDWTLVQLLKIDKDKETKWFLWFWKKISNWITNMYEYWKNNKQKMFNSNVINTPYQFIKIYWNIFYLPNIYYHFHSKSLNYWIQQKVLYNMLKYFLTHVYWINVKFLLIHKHEKSWTDSFKWPFNINTISFEFQTIETELIYQQLKKDWLFEKINYEWTTININYLI